MGVIFYYNAKLEVDLDGTLLDTPTGYLATSPHPLTNRKWEQTVSSCFRWLTDSPPIPEEFQISTAHPISI